MDASLRGRLDALEHASSPLDPDPDRRDRLRAAVHASSEQFLRSIESGRAFVEDDDGGDALHRWPITEDGIPLETVLNAWEEGVVRPGGHPASGAHLAYITGGGLYHSALADYLAAVSNKYTGVAFTGPGPVRLENMLIRWVADLVGYPKDAGGYIASGGSIANLTAIVAARDAYELSGAEYGSAVVYLTDQAHHCIEKALRIAGLGEAVVRRVGLDERYRMRPDDLARAIAADRARGLRPWLIAATAGTTDTGAVDPLDEIAEIARREECWFHVDAAYGGFFLLTEEGRRILAGIERSDSVVLDPHKSLFMPWGSGIVVVRDVRNLITSHAGTGDYLQDTLDGLDEISPADVSPELTKHFRAARMWFPLVLLGTRPFRAALEEKLLLARYFHREVQRLGFDVSPEPDLSTVTFRWAPTGMDPEESDEVNRVINDAVRSDGRVFLSSTVLDGRYTLRVAPLSFRTHRRTLDLTLDILDEKRREVSPGL